MTTPEPRGRRRPRALSAAARRVAALLGLAALAGCAAIPTAGGVRESDTDVASAAGEIAFIAAGPQPGAEPEQIVAGFLAAGPAGPTSSTQFAVADEFLAPQARSRWVPYERVLVLDGEPVLRTDPPNEGSERTAVVRATVSVVATVDERGVYQELPAPSTQTLTYALVRGVDAQWRISQLEDGLLLSTTAFRVAYRPTRLYFPTPDRAYWVPDERWFPKRTWRTNAVNEILAGPPGWLAGSTTSVVPDGTSLSFGAVTVDEETRTVPVNLSSQILEASAEDRALVAAQLEATLTDGVGEGRTVRLFDRSTELSVSGTAAPARARTTGPALVVLDGRLGRLEGRSVEDVGTDLLDGLTPTALATGDEGALVVVRDGADRLVRVTGEGAPVEILTGPGLVAPSVDRFGTVWSAVPGGALQAVDAQGSLPYPVTAEWLENRSVTGVRVAPDGARVAVLSTGSDGPRVDVAGILRDGDQVPTGLSDPVRVGAPVQDPEQVVWVDETSLAVVGTDADGDRGVNLTGVGGLAGQAGLTRQVTTIGQVQSVAAGGSESSLLVLGADGALHARQSSALWPVVATDVSLVTYPG